MGSIATGRLTTDFEWQADTFRTGLGADVPSPVRRQLSVGQSDTKQPEGKCLPASEPTFSVPAGLQRLAPC